MLKRSIPARLRVAGSRSLAARARPSPLLSAALLPRGGSSRLLGARTLHATAVSRAQDYYDVLGLPKTASTGEIKRKYYEKAKQYHPDTNKNDPEAAKKFAAATEAYEVQSPPPGKLRHGRCPLRRRPPTRSRRPAP